MVDHSPSNPSDFHANFCKMKYGENRCTCGYTQVYAVPDVSPVRCVNHDYYSDTYCPWCRAENAEQRLAEANEALRRWEGSCTDAMADNRWLRAALESIIHHAPGTWQADEAREALRPSADASKTPSHVSVTAGTSAVAGFCNPTQDGRPSAESTETVPNADKVAFSRLQTQAMSCDSAQDDRARPADETHKASAELKDRAAGETPMCAKPFCSKPASRGLYCDTCSPDDMSDPETGVPLTPWGKRK